MACAQNNIVVFPNKFREIPPQSEEDILKRVEGVRKQVADIVCEEVVGGMFRTLQNYGIVVTADKSVSFMKDVALIIEGIKSATFRSLKFDHPLQDFSEKVFELKGENEVRLNVDMLIVKE